jgi:hypothetical protein
VVPRGPLAPPLTSFTGPHGALPGLLFEPAPPPDAWPPFDSELEPEVPVLVAPAFAFGSAPPLVIEGPEPELTDPEPPLVAS